MNNFSGHPKPQEPFGPSQELNGGEFRTPEDFCFVEGSHFSMLNLSGTRSRLPYGLTDDITTDAASMLSCKPTSEWIQSNQNYIWGMAIS